MWKFLQENPVVAIAALGLLAFIISLSTKEASSVRNTQAYVVGCREKTKTANEFVLCVKSLQPVTEDKQN